MALADEDRIGFQGGWGLDWISSTCVVRLPVGLPDAVEAHLRASGIDTRRWWSEGCHLAPAFLDCPRSDLRVTKELASSSLGIPFFADLHAGQINDTAAALRSVIDGIQPQARSQAL
jgi:dTDP-4-amino-4,6-dideoxygalactose transaminase